MSKDKNDVVIINLDRPRELRFGHKAIKTLGAITGKELDALAFTEEIALEEIEKVIYCGLLSDAKAHGETLKLEDMEDLLDKASSFSDIIEKMQQAFQAAFGTLGDDEAGKLRQAKPKK